MESQKFCLKWDAFEGSVTSAFDLLRHDEELVDITVCCRDLSVRAHRVMLSACSPFFRRLLTSYSPCDQMVVFLKDTTAADLEAVITFIYRGSVNVAQSQLASFIKTAEMLQIRGLSGDDKPCPERSAGRPLSAADSAPPSKRRRHGCTGSPPPSPSAPFTSPFSCPLLPRPGPRPRPELCAEVALFLSETARQRKQCHRPSTATGTGTYGHRWPIWTYGHHPPPHSESASSAPAAGAVKIEKIDLTDDAIEGDGNRDASLEDPHVDYAAEDVNVGGEVGFSVGSPDLSLDDLSQAALAEEGFGDGALREASFTDAAGETQEEPGMLARTRRAHAGVRSEQEGGVFTCPICGRRYSNPRSLEYHKKMHWGLTTCVLCGKVASKVEHLRRHLENVHKLTQPDIRRIVPTRHRNKGTPGMMV